VRPGGTGGLGGVISDEVPACAPGGRRGDGRACQTNFLVRARKRVEQKHRIPDPVWQKRDNKKGKKRVVSKGYQ